MKNCVCDLCKKDIEPAKGIEFKINTTIYDLCVNCLKIIDKVRCKNCKGTGKIREVDVEASHRVATCGENRTEYRTVTCQKCK